MSVSWGKNGGYLLDIDSGEKIPIQRKGRLYVLRMWVKDSTKDGAKDSRRQP